MGRTVARTNGGGHTEVTEPRDARVDIASEEETGLNLKALKEKKIGELAQIARDFSIEHFQVFDGHSSSTSPLESGG